MTSAGSKQTKHKKSKNRYYVKKILIEPRGVHPRGNHDRGRDHRVTRGDCRAWIPPGSQTVASHPYSERSANDRLSSRSVRSRDRKSDRLLARRRGFAQLRQEEFHPSQ